MTPYAIEGLGVGMPVVPNSPQYKRYKCKPSEQYENSVTCRFTETIEGIHKVITILHLYNNIVTYINKSVSPASFTKQAIEREIQRLSERFGGAPHIYSSRIGLMATWGDIKLQQLTQNDLTILAQDQNPNLGFLVDYLMNFHESARAGLPVYRLGGGKGFVWIAKFDDNVKEGVLRFLAADPSQMKLSAREPPESPSRPAQEHHEAPASNQPEPKASELVSTGTGFFVARDGSFVTNAHVIEDCTMVRVKTDDASILDAKIIARDATNDLAILHLDKSPKKIAALRVAIRLGEGVAAFGFPHADILSSSGNFTVGNITALSGMGDDSRSFQFSAPVQAGNSGGPLLDMFGNVVGVVSAKLNALKMAAEGGDLPQNVNFAVKSAILASFLDANRVTFEVAASGGQKPLEAADVADQARAISGFVVCK
jgi:S1-C subfamily serine protease